VTAQARTALACACALFAWAPRAVAQAKEPDPGPPGTVTLPLVDYERLVDRAARPSKRPEAPPLPAIISRADLRVRVTGSLARAACRMEGEVLRTGPTKVALLADGTLFEVRSSGGAVPLLREGAGHAAILTGPAPFALDLEWGTLVASEPGRASFTLAVPASGTARAAVEVPGMAPR